MPVPVETSRTAAEVATADRSRRRLFARLVQLYLGLSLYGVSAAMQVQAGLGLDPWDVLHQGLAGRVHLAIGTVSIIVGAIVLLGWLPIRQRPGLGTISNVFVVGLSLNATLRVLPVQHVLAARLALLVAAIVLCGLATGMYISVGFGPGPRDGLMTGWSARTGLSIRLTRTLIEVTVLVTGWLLGGTVGVGTVLFAVSIGPVAQVFLKLFGVNKAKAAAEHVAV
ncbi:MAG: hypothetical protein QOK10_3639 [Pseudonocardiales bacterium]|jgi:uncharacterized membrane protein YczE|nr:hypothetical protein [Pseudonocardiales bacterium]